MDKPTETSKSDGRIRFTINANDTIRAALIKGALNPWVGLAFCVGFGLGYLSKAIVG